MRRRWKAVIVELSHHLPYTVVSSLIAMAVVWYFGMTQNARSTGTPWTQELEWSFHVLHPLHVCISAITTTAALWRFERHFAKTLAVGLSSVIPCALSDYIVPFVGGKLLGQHMTLHICLIEHPQLILPFLGLGVVGGFLFDAHVSDHSPFSHGAHVFISSCAALLYLASFGFTAWMTDVHMVFPVLMVVVLAVWIPCCISDIVIPISAVHERHVHPHGRDRSLPRA